MSLTVILLLAGLIGTHAQGFTTSTSCSAFGSLSIRVKSGRCRGRAAASCTAHASATSQIDEQVRALSTQDFCSPVVVQSTAGAMATAVASVHTQALSQVKCTGQGFGCGFALSQGSSFAQGYAEAFAKSVAAAFVGPNSGVCLADIRALATAIAEAAASAQASSCVSGRGSATQFSSAFVKSVSVAIARAFALATAEVCGKNELSATSKCTAEVEGSSNVLLPCPSNIKICCFDRVFFGCPNGYKLVLPVSRPRVVGHTSGTKCVCGF
ncbi:hypothetical protein BSKO_07201 [Bryopsis sp. KO-2023]|nr:hypothetical protein BSKO_07201 [Bryopsis sp. KO-2023]